MLLGVLAAVASQSQSVSDDEKPTPNAATPATPSVSESVVVTAQKREQDLLEVPISIGLISGDKLTAENRYEYQDLQYLLPGLTTQASVGTTWSLNVRGVGTSAHSDGVTGSVGIAIDGVVLGREGMGLLDLVDVERIELLRGPQGTLFGKNASAGLLNVVTRAPRSEFHIDFGAAVASRDERRIRATIGGSLGDERISSRLTAYSNQRDGIVQDINLNRAYNGKDQYGARGKIQFQATDNLVLAGTVDFIQDDEICCRWTSRTTSPGRHLGTYESPVVPGPENLEVNTSSGYEGERESGGFAFNVTRSLVISP